MADDQGYDSSTGRTYKNEYKGDKAGAAPSNVKTGGFTASAAGAKKFRNQNPGESIQDYIAAKKKAQQDDENAVQQKAITQ